MRIKKITYRPCKKPDCPNKVQNSEGSAIQKEYCSRKCSGAHRGAATREFNRKWLKGGLYNLQLYYKLLAARSEIAYNEYVENPHSSTPKRNTPTTPTERQHNT